MGDLLVIGPGRLGMLVARAWRESHAEAKILLKFRSDNAERRDQLTAEGFLVPSPDDNDLSADQVVFCAPPTGNPDYAADVENGFKYLKSGGLLVFTSSGSVFAENSGATVNEDSELNTTERSKALIDSEKVVISKGGCVIRLGGLYCADTGAHHFYARGGEFNVKPDGLINLVSYEDAAAAVLAALNQAEKAGGKVFLTADGVPVSRKDILTATLNSTPYKGSPEVTFTGGEGVDGKKYDTSRIRDVLGWSPSQPSFVEFMATL